MSLMRNYEVAYIADPDLDEQALAALDERVAGWITGAGGTTLQVSASTAVSFEQNRLEAPAGTAFVIHFENNQAGVPHNVWIKDAQGEVVFEGRPDVTGPQAADYVVSDGLPAGTYTFYCQIHPNMTGTLEVK